MRWVHAVVAACFVAAASADALQFRGGDLDTSSVPSLSLQHTGETVSLENALPRTLSLPSSSASLVSSRRPSTRVSPSAEDIYIVQLDADYVTDFSDRHAADIIGYVPQNAFLVRSSASNVASLQKQRGVRWLNVLPAEHRISPRLRELLDAGSPLSADGESASGASGPSAETLSTDSAQQKYGEFASLFVTSDFDVTADVYAPAVPSRRGMATLSASADDDAHRAGDNSAFSEVSSLPPRAAKKDAAAADSQSAESRRARFSASLAAAPGASFSAAGLPQHSLTAMITAPVDLPASLAGVRGGFADVHASAARATADGIATVLGGGSKTAAAVAADKFAALAAETLSDDLRVLKVASAAPVVAALRRALPPVPAAAAANRMATASYDAKENGNVAGVPTDYSPLFPLSAALDTVSPSVMAAPRDNQGNFESVSSLAFTFQSPLFAVPVPLDPAAAAAASDNDGLLKVGPEDVSSLVAEAAFNVAGEAARAPAPAAFAALAADREAVSAIATGSRTPLARHIAAVARAIALASAEGHAADEVQGGFAALAASGEYHRALARATASVLSLQTRWVGAAVAAAVARLTESPEVLLVDVIPQYQPLNKRARWVVTTFNDPVPLNAPRYENQMTPFHASGLTGEGHIVGVADSGIDGRSCYFIDTANSVPFGSAGDTRHRKIVQYVDFMDRFDTPGGHGSHVVGTIAGAAVAAGGVSPVTEHDGMAPGAKIAFFDLERSRDALFAVPNNIDDLLAPAYNIGARIHSNSWGCYNSFDQRPADFCNEYGSSDYYFDRFMKRRNDFLAIIAAGNDGSYAHRTVGSPATAKNVLSVGAASQSLSSAKENNLDSEQLTHPDYFNIRSLASFSSTGPTADGRIKPDVTAPGHAVVSARARMASTTGTISCESHVMSGTSMATPVVSGGAVIARDHIRKGFVGGKGKASASKAIENPAGSLIKAVMVNSAQDLTFRQGTGGMTTVPMFRQNKGNKVKGREHFPMGRLFSIVGNLNSKMYIKPSTTAATNITVIVERMRSGAKWSVEIRGPGFPDSSSSGADSLPAIAEYSDDVIVAQTIALPAGAQVSLDITASGSSADKPTYIGILEFEGSGEPLRSRPVSCNTVFSDLPTFKYSASSDSVEDTTYSVTCPAPATCQRASAAVYGVSMYSSDSSICRSAIHTGSINVTDSSPQAVVPSPILFRGPGSRSLTGSSRNGVTSRSGRIYAGENVYMPNFGGSPEEEFPSVFPVPASANMMTGHGGVDLAAVLQLADPSAPDAASATESVRQMVILGDGTGDLTQKSWRTRCFLVSHMPEKSDGYSAKDISYTFSVGPSRVKVTMTWPDFAQTVKVYPSIVNDLDLHVFGPRGEEWRGNDAADRLNTVEQVWLRSFQSGLYCATASGHKVPIGAQKYAVVASGPGVEECPATASGAIPLTGTYAVSGVSCEAGVPADVTAVFSDTSVQWGAVQAGKCFSLRDSPVPATGANALPFNGLRRSTASATRGHYDATASLAAAGMFPATVGAKATLQGTDRFEYRVELVSGDATAGSAVLKVTVSEPGATAGCTATLTAGKTAADVQAEVVEPARHDRDEPPMNGAVGAAGASVWVAMVAVAIAAVTLFF